MPNSEYLVSEESLANMPDAPAPQGAGAPPIPNNMPPYFAGSLAPQLQQNADYVGVQVGTPRIPIHSLMPFGNQASAFTNAAAQSTVIKTAPSVPGINAIGFNGPIEISPQTQKVTLPGPIVWGWAPELSGTVFSGPVPANLLLNSVDYEDAGSVGLDTISFFPTAHNSDFSILIFTGNGTSSTPAGWTTTSAPVLYYQQTPPGAFSVTCNQTGGPANEIIAGLVAGFNAPNTTVTPTNIATTGGSWGSAGINLSATFTSANKTVLAFVTASGSTDGSGGIQHISDTMGNDWILVGTASSSYSAIIGGITHYFMATVTAWVCINPVVGTYNITTVPSTNAGQSITGAEFSIFDISGITSISGIPSFKPFNDFLSLFEGVTSLNGLTGDVDIVAGTGISVGSTGQDITIANTGVTSLNSETGDITIVAGSGITVTPLGQNITIAASGGSGAASDLFSFPAATLYNISPTNATYTAAPINGTANGIQFWYFNLDVNVTFQKIYFIGAGTDSTNHYDIGIYTKAGVLQANIGATLLSLGGLNGYPILQTSVTLAPGPYLFAITSNGAGTFKFGIAGDLYGSPICLCNGTSGAPSWIGTTTPSSGGVLPSSMTPVFTGVSVVYVSNPPAQPIFALGNY
jgi:hypothetical protein